MKQKNTQSRELYKLIGYCNNECNTTSLTLAMEMRDHHAHEAKQRGNLSRSPQGLWNNLTTQNQKKWNKTSLGIRSPVYGDY